MQNIEVQIIHVYREANQLADSVVNDVFEKEGKQQYHHFLQLPSTTRRVLNMDKSEVPTLRIRARPIVSRRHVFNYSVNQEIGKKEKKKIYRIRYPQQINKKGIEAAKRAYIYKKRALSGY